MPIRWRLTLFNALIMGAILLVVGFFVFFLLRNALLSGVTDTAKSWAVEIAQDVEEEPGEHPLEEDDAEKLAQDGVSSSYGTQKDASSPRRWSWRTTSERLIPFGERRSCPGSPQTVQRSFLEGMSRTTSTPCR